MPIVLILAGIAAWFLLGESNELEALSRNGTRGRGDNGNREPGSGTKDNREPVTDSVPVSETSLKKESNNAGTTDTNPPTGNH